MSTTRLWSQQPRCHVCTNSTLSVPLLKSGSEDICCNTAVTAWQTNFKVNHIYSCGSNLISAESVKKLRLSSTPSDFPGKNFFLMCLCGEAVPPSWYHWCPWYPPWPGPPAAETAAPRCRSERHGAGLRSCGTDGEQERWMRGGGRGRRDAEGGLRQWEQRSYMSHWWFYNRRHLFKITHQHDVSLSVRSIHAIRRMCLHTCNKKTVKWDKDHLAVCARTKVWGHQRLNVSGSLSGSSIFHRETN